MNVEQLQKLQDIFEQIFTDQNKPDIHYVNLQGYCTLMEAMKTVQI